MTGNGGSKELKVPFLRGLLPSHVWDLGLLEGWALLRPSARIAALSFSSTMESGRWKVLRRGWLSSE